MSRNLKREIKDLDDVRAAITNLKELRERESDVDAFLSPVEEMYRLLSVYEVSVSKEESDQVGDLRYSWRKLLSLANEMNNGMNDLQVRTPTPPRAGPCPSPEMPHPISPEATTVAFDCPLYALC